jgi:hypothetical protein
MDEPFAALTELTDVFGHYGGLGLWADGSFSIAAHGLHPGLSQAACIALPAACQPIMIGFRINWNSVGAGIAPVW